MLTVREIKDLARRLDDAAFEKQLGPFVLVERPFKKDGSRVKPGATAKVTAPMAPKKPRKSVFDFDELWVATLPPIASRDEFLVGRSPDVDVMLDEETVSKHHAKVHWHGKYAELEDLGSSNGTFLNGTRLGPNLRQRLRDNDAIDFGGVQVYFLHVASMRNRMGKV